MIIRPYDGSDHAGLRKLYHETRVRTFVWLDTSRFRVEDFERDTEGELIWVAVENGDPAGFVSVWKPENFIHHLYVTLPASGRGVGSALLTHCLSRIGRPAALKCKARNVVARDFYLRRQWEIIAEGEDSEGNYLLMHHS